MAVRRVVPHLHSRSFEASRDFYGGLLGLEAVMDLGWILTFASPANRTAQVNVYAATAPPASLQPAMSIEVDDVDAAHAEAVRRGLDIVYPLTDEPWGVRRFFVEDPDGNIVNILSHQPEATP